MTAFGQIRCTVHTIIQQTAMAFVLLHDRDGLSRPYVSDDPYFKIREELFIFFCRQPRLFLDRPSTLVKSSLSQPPLALRDSIQIESRTYQRQMRECLRRIAQLLSTFTNLFRKHRQVVAEAQRILEERDGLLEVFALVGSCAGQCFHEPERAH